MDHPQATYGDDGEGREKEEIEEVEEVELIIPLSFFFLFSGSSSPQGSPEIRDPFDANARSDGDSHRSPRRFGESVSSRRSFFVVREADRFPVVSF